MPVIDLSTLVGKIKYRVGDYLDLQRLPDEVYESALADTNNNLRAATILCAQYILAGLAFDVDQRLNLIQVYGSQSFAQYKQYLMLVIKEPALNQTCPIPYVAGADTLHPILQFQQDFKNAQTRPNSDERLSQIAVGPFNPYSGAVVNEIPQIADGG